MATYVPGVETYLPDIKPFTPDYKFLSAVLDVRTDKYNTNWKATNDLYNKVVYADLSRTDTKEQRDQYINQIAPSLEKISGMDLSMVQNADSAKAVFAPFFEDDLIVSDILHTSNYRKEMDYSKRLENSIDEDQRHKWNEDGVRSLQYQMEDFITAAPDKAMRMGLPQYVEGANLMGMAQKMLGEMKPPLKIKMDSPQGDWIITQQNGTLVIPAATAYLEKTLLSDPRVVKYYQNQAFVRSRDRAATGIASGQFATVEQGQAAWAQETIQKINEQNEYYLKQERIKAAKGKTIEEKWINYQKTNGVVPGSDDEKAMTQQLSTYERTKAALESRENIKQLANEPVKDFQATLNKAYNLYSQSVIKGDITQAAAVFASRDSETTIRVNDYVKQRKDFEYDMDKIQEQAENAIILEKFKNDNAYELAKAKGEIKFDKDGKSLNPILEEARQFAPIMGDERNTDYKVGKDGKPIETTEMNGNLVAEFSKERTEEKGDAINFVTRILSFLNPAGEVDAEGKRNQKYTIKLAGQNFTGSIEQIKTKLSEKEGSIYKYRTDITNLYNEQSAILDDPKQMAAYPGLAQSQTYKNLYEGIYGSGGLNSRIKITENTFKEVSKIYKVAHDQVLEDLRVENPKAKKLMDQGMPGLFTSGERPVELSREAYIKNVAALAEQGKIQGIDRVQMRKPEYMNYVDEDFIQNGRKQTRVNIVYSDQPLKEAKSSYPVNSVMYTDKTGRLVRAEDRNQLDKNSVRPATILSQADIKDKAGDFYDSVKEYSNSALTMHKGDKYKTATFKGFKYGKTSGPDMFTENVYKFGIDPLSPTEEGQTMLSQMMRQKKVLDAEGGGYKIVLGNLKDVKDKASIQNNELAIKAYNAYVADMITWLGNSERSNSAGIAPRGTILYSSILGPGSEGKKTTAGYTLDGFDQWLSTKVKGSSKDDGSGEYGLFSTKDVIALKNGISMVFEQDKDINPRSSKNQYFSPVLSDINSSPEKFAEYSYPGIDGLTPTATYRIVQTGTDQYYSTYKVNYYQPDGTYTSSDWQQTPIEIGTLNVGQAVQAQVEYMENYFRIIRDTNSEDHDKNSATKGKKK